LTHSIFHIKTTSSSYQDDVLVILTVGNTKGGVGKTTLAVQIALGRAQAGRDVWLVDGDRQGTALTAISIRGDDNRQPAIACSQYFDGPKLRQQVQHQSGRYDDVVIDVGGQDSSALRAALVLSDVLIVPFQPRSFDVWALTQISRLIEEARSVRDDLLAYALLNCADPINGGSDNREAYEALTDYPQLKLLDAPLRRRKAFANASGQGRGVDEMNPKDPKACGELFHLMSLLFKDEKRIENTSM
jgi:chromosome partitioning protein